MTSRRARLVRATLAAVVTTFVAALSHSMAGAPAPGSLAIVLSLVFSLLVCIALTARRLSTWRLSLAVVASQYVYHSLFTLFAGSGWGIGTAMNAWAGAAGADGSGHDHLAMAARQLAAVPVSTGDAASMAGMNHDDTWMFMAHLMAAVVTVVALRRGERAFWALVDGTRVFVRQLLGLGRLDVTVVGTPWTTTAGRDAAFPTALAALISPMRHRGPPPLVAC